MSTSSVSQTRRSAIAAGIYLLLLAILAGAIIFSCAQNALAKPTPAHGGRAKACQTVTACHHALAWHRKYERHLLAIKFPRHDALYALRLAAAYSGLPYTRLVCIGEHESGLGNQLNSEPGSGASGLMQFLPSTWAHTPFAAYGFSVWDMTANALAAAQIMVHDGSARQWTTGRGCGL